MKDFFSKLWNERVRRFANLQHELNGLSTQFDTLSEEHKKALGRIDRLEERIRIADNERSELRRTVSELRKIAYGRLDDGK